MAIAGAELPSMQTRPVTGRAVRYWQVTEVLPCAGGGDQSPFCGGRPPHHEPASQQPAGFCPGGGSCPGSGHSHGAVPAPLLSRSCCCCRRAALVPSPAQLRAGAQPQVLDPSLCMVHLFKLHARSAEGLWLKHACSWLEVLLMPTSLACACIFAGLLCLP